MMTNEQILLRQIDILWEAVQAIAFEEEEPKQLAIRAMDACIQVPCDNDDLRLMMSN